MGRSTLARLTAHRASTENANQQRYLASLGFTQPPTPTPTHTPTRLPVRIMGAKQKQFQEVYFTLSLWQLKAEELQRAFVLRPLCALGDGWVCVLVWVLGGGEAQAREVSLLVGVFGRCSVRCWSREG